ncbi:MAG: sigma-70 family RNA polymerase sigma factor [Microscillaceae bacterium]|nr:sigma-70 family RNA polymerase sigma factor [Microscillaceae bacterium]
MSQKEDNSEKALILGIQNGDNESLKKVYKANFPSIMHFILSNNGSEQEAKDIYQDAMIVFYEKLQDKDFRLNCQIKTFLYSISRRLWLKRLAEKNKYVSQIDDFEAFLPLDRFEISLEEHDHKFEIMRQALEKLGDPCKTVLKDFYIEKKSMQEIAQEMGYTNPENAKNQKYKCLQRLKKLFFQHYKETNS